MSKRHVLIPIGAGALACCAIALGFRASRTALSDRPSPPQPVMAPPAPADSNAAAAAGGGPAGVASSPAPFDIDPTVDYLDLGRSAWARRDWAAAVEHLQRAAVQHPDACEPHYLLGLALRQQGRLEESHAALERALEIAPHAERVAVNSARTLIELGRFDDAEARVRAALEAAPQDSEAWNVLGRALMSRGALADAEPALERACELDSTNAWARNNLGLVRLQRGAWAEAAAVLEEAVRLRGDVAYFHNNLGLCWERLGREAEAAAAYARAVELLPGYGKAQVSLARVGARVQALAQCPAPADSGAAALLSVQP